MSDQKRITRSFWAVVIVGFLVLAAFGWIIKTNTDSTTRSLCRVDRAILLRQLAGTKQNRTTDRFFRDHSRNPDFRSHFGALVPIQTGRIIEIQAELKILGRCN